MSSTLAKTLIAVVATGGAVASTVAGVMHSKRGDVSDNLQSQIYVNLAQEGNTISDLTASQDLNSVDSARAEDLKEAESEPTEVKDSEKTESEPETGSKVSDGGTDLNDPPADQAELQKENDLSRTDSPEEKLEAQDPSRVAAQEETDKYPEEFPPQTLSVEEDNVDQGQPIENGGYFVFELDEYDDSYSEIEWGAHECDREGREGKIVFSCPWNYTDDGREIDFYINISSINSEKYDLNKLTELAWAPYGSYRSDLTLTFDGRRNLVIELERGPK